MACLVGIDFGIKRTGLSCTDPNQMIASGLKNLPTAEVITFLEAYCQKEEVAAFIIGQPLQKDGSPSAVEERIQEFIRVLKNKFPNQSIARYDERFTSKLAVQAMVDGGLKKKQRKKKGMIDQVSATLILQSYLDYKTNTI
ncbi:Holliday junction resolvase RuvX [Flavobacteriaceae bacterium]|nr:Holliday junction resolvase RuvX [Flavobacteriaceae bacterium]MDA9015849.1 Holliday junction resolvase RuvX [Flavobacteriaceae bacterium]MDB3862808.1 Holliday junction resolvase RuvX [Flavobacteriaceae bacterium]MDC3354542.1 Holliday junction resolvase RuvX [Flavobacteriaceae bacterium]